MCEMQVTDLGANYFPSKYWILMCYTSFKESAVPIHFHDQLFSFM